VCAVLADLASSASFESLTISEISDWALFTITLTFVGLEFTSRAHEAMATVKEVVVLASYATCADLAVASVLNELAIRALDRSRNDSQQSDGELHPAEYLACQPAKSECHVVLLLLQG